MHVFLFCLCMFVCVCVRVSECSLRLHFSFKCKGVHSCLSWFSFSFIPQRSAGAFAAHMSIFIQSLCVFTLRKTLDPASYSSSRGANIAVVAVMFCRVTLIQCMYVCTEIGGPQLFFKKKVMWCKSREQATAYPPGSRRQRIERAFICLSWWNQFLKYDALLAR